MVSFLIDGNELVLVIDLNKVIVHKERKLYVLPQRKPLERVKGQEVDKEFKDSILDDKGERELVNLKRLGGF